MTWLKKHGKKGYNPALDIEGESLNEKYAVFHEYYLEEARHHPQDMHVWLALGWSAPSGLRALRFFEQARLLEPRHPLALFSLAWAKRHLDRWNALGTEAIPEPIVKTLSVSGINDLEEALKAVAAREAQKSTPQSVLIWSGVYLAAITFAEILTTIPPVAGIGLMLHAILLVVLILHSAFNPEPRLRRVYLSLVLAPLIRLLSLSIPLKDIPMMYWYLLVGAPLFISIGMIVRYGAFEAKSIGISFHRWPLQILFGVIGIGLGYVEYIILKPQPLVTEFNFLQILFPALILLIFTGLLEEVIFRGLMQNAFISVMGKWGGLLFVSLIFAVLHFGYRSLWDVGFVFAVSLLFGVLTLISGSILGVTLAHGATNICLFLIFPFILGQAAAPAETAPAGVLMPHGAQSFQLLEPTPFSPYSESTQMPAQVFNLATQTRQPAGTSTPVPSATLAAIPGFTIVIDDGDDGFWQGGGIWTTSPLANQGDLVWAENSSTADVIVEWLPEMDQCGSYRLEVFIPSDYGTSRQALYEISHRAGTDYVSLDQKNHAQNWATLGTYEFAPGAPAKLKLSSLTGESPGTTRVAFDAARWLYLGPCDNGSR